MSLVEQQSHYGTRKKSALQFIQVGRSGCPDYKFYFFYLGAECQGQLQWEIICIQQQQDNSGKK